MNLETDEWFPRVRGEGGSLGKKGVTSNRFGIALTGDEKVLKLLMVIVPQLCEYSKTS